MPMRTPLRRLFWWLPVMLLLIGSVWIVLLILPPFFPPSHPGFDEIERGMTRGEVDRLLADWSFVSEQEQARETQVKWYKGLVDVTVTFDARGKVVSKGLYRPGKPRYRKEWWSTDGR